MELQEFPYSATFTAQGGTAPLKWDVIDGALAPGFAVSQDGVLSGTFPAFYGGWDAQFTVRVSDSAPNPNTANKSFTFDIFGFQPTSIPTPQVGVDYSQFANFGAIGGKKPITWQFSGALPDGLAFTKNPSSPAPESISSSARHRRLDVTSFPSWLQIPVCRHAAKPCPIPWMLNRRCCDYRTSCFHRAWSARPTDFTFPHSGGAAPYAWTFTPTSPLPLGMQFDSVNGKLTGTPTAPGYAFFALYLSDSSSPTRQQTQQGYWLLVTPNSLPLRNDTIANATPIYYPGDYSASSAPMVIRRAQPPQTRTTTN